MTIFRILDDRTKWPSVSFETWLLMQWWKIMRKVWEGQKILPKMRIFLSKRANYSPILPKIFSFWENWENLFVFFSWFSHDFCQCVSFSHDFLTIFVSVGVLYKIRFSECSILSGVSGLTIILQCDPFHGICPMHNFFFLNLHLTLNKVASF